MSANLVGVARPLGVVLLFPLLLVNDVVLWWLRPRLRVALTSDQPRFDLCLHPPLVPSWFAAT